jgi:cobaltochelatase CobN
VIRILALTAMDNSSDLNAAAGRLLAEHGDLCSIQKFYFNDVESHSASLEPVREAVAAADIILIDVRSDTRLGRILPDMLAGHNKTVVVLIAASNEVFALTNMGAFSGSMMFKPGQDRSFSITDYIRVKKFSALGRKLSGLLPVRMLRDMNRWMLVQEYYAQGGADNLYNMLLVLLKHYGGCAQIKKIAQPRSVPAWGLYCPGRGTFTDRASCERAIGFDPQRPTVAVLMHGGMHFSDTLPVVDLLYARLRAQVNVLIIFSSVEANMDALRACCDGIDLLITMQYFRLWGGPYGGDPEVIYQFLRERDVPLLVGVRAFETDLESWLSGSSGLSPIETVLAVTLPELDGAVEPFMLGALEVVDDGAIGRVKRQAALPGRVERFGERILKWLALRTKPAQQKKIALLCYSYPPGEHSLAGAGYLDVFASLERMLERLRSHGYDVHIPDDGLKNFFLSHGIVNSPVYQHPGGIRVPLAHYEQWFGTLPQSVQQQVIDAWGLPPGTVMVDGPDLLVPGAVLGNIFIGVQPARGDHEKNDSLYHDKALVPHHQYLAFYCWLEQEFNADAVVHFGTHGTLEFLPGKEVALSGECFPDILLGSLPNIYYYWVGNPSEATIAKRRGYALCVSHASPSMTPSGLYEDYLVLEDLLEQYARDPGAETLEAIQAVSRELHLPPETSELARELYRMKSRLIPHGLHVLDAQYSDHQLRDLMLGALQFEREQPSIFTLTARALGRDWKTIKHTPEEERVREAAAQALDAILDNNPPPWCDADYLHYVHALRQRFDFSAESAGLLRALDGRYVFPARAGDPLRDPDVYPTGRGMYAFDPRLIPTPAAQVRGTRAAEKLLGTYHAKHGAWPATVGIILWGFETMKTGGDTIAMILHLLGVRIRHRASAWLKELELIPLAELGRPRIDVLVSMCGIFRDTFGTHIDLISRACALAAEQDEPPEQNFIRRHCQNLPDACEAAMPLRLFGPAPDQYATDLPALIETGMWQSEDELGNAFAASMNHAYTGGSSSKNSQALESMLGSVALIAQERDGSEYDVTDLDHYYEFMGGMARAAAACGAESADIMVVDQAGDDTDVEELASVVERAARTRTLNPRWLEGMLAHDFHGGKIVKDRVEYLLGLAATTHAVESWVFDKAAERLIFDDSMRARLERNNPYATQRMAEVLLESNRRGYWQASDEQIKKLRDLMLALEGGLE